VRLLLRDAEQLLAAAGAGDGDESHAICLMPPGGLRVVAHPEGWSLPALAADVGAKAVYLVERRNGAVRVEGWSPTEKIVLERQAAAVAAAGSRSYATREILGL
jgi:hypothetical protein